MTDKQKEKFNQLFTRYGSPSKEGEIRINKTFYSPGQVYNFNKLRMYDEWAADALNRLNEAIEQVQAYRIAICERYNELQFANVEKVIKLKREKNTWDNKVYYFLMFIERHQDGHEEIIKSDKYAGIERKKALEDFENFVKNNKNYIAVKDIEKSRFEK